MSQATGAVLVFLVGFFSGGLALYSIVGLAISTPRTAMTLLQYLSDKIGIGRWLTFRETTADVTCPHCGAVETFAPGEDA